MASAFNLPRLVFGAGSLSALPDELARLKVGRPLLLSDRGLEKAGIVAHALATITSAAAFLDVPPNPTAAGADAALRAYRDGHCDGIVALGGGSVLDTGKIVAALAGSGSGESRELIGKPGQITAVAPLVAISTTLGTGSDSSPVCGIHLETNGPAIGTRDSLLVPRVAICDPDLARTLPRALIAATGIDALSHCVEGFFANPPNAIIDALALDGLARVCADIRAALAPEGDDARASLMAAAFAGGAAIHKGLGPAHAVASACGDQDVHHGTLIGVALPVTTRLLAAHLPDKAARVRAAMGLAADADIGDALHALIASLGLPVSLAAAGYRIDVRAALVDAMVASHFNRTSPYVPTADDYAAVIEAIA